MRGRVEGSADLFQPTQFPRSAKYDRDWALENMMGPNVLWLTESLAEAHDLPFSDGFFDAMISVDAYHYFGTDDLYLENHMARLGKPSDEADMLALDRGQTLGFTRMAARRNERPTAGLDTV